MTIKHWCGAREGRSGGRAIEQERRHQPLDVRNVATSDQRDRADEGVTASISREEMTPRQRGHEPRRRGIWCTTAIYYGTGIRAKGVLWDNRSVS
jgi:hypothetical protein